MQSAPAGAGSSARLARSPSPSITITSPGATSRTISAPDEVERAALRGDDPVLSADAAEDERPEAVRVAEGDELPLRERHDRVRAVEPLHRVRDRLGERRLVVRDQGRDQLAVGGRAQRHAVGVQVVAHLTDVDEVAVVAERDRARAAVLDERLRVRPLRRARRRVARVADRDLAAQAVQLLLVEDLRDEAEVAQRRQPAVLGDGDPRRLLAAVLEREQAEVGEARDVAFGGVDAEHAAHQAATCPIWTKPREPSRGEVSGRAGEDRRAPPRVVAGRQLDVGGEAAAPRRGLRERRLDPSGADVVAEREHGCSLPQEPDERRLGGEAAVGRGREQHRVARLPLRPGPSARRRRARRSRPPASAGSRRRPSRCRARRCRRRRGSRARRPPARSPRSPVRAPSAIPGFSGLPKLRQSVRPIGSPPAHATLRAAPSAAGRPRGSGPSRRAAGPSSATASPRSDGRSRSTAASKPGRRIVREPTRWSYCSNTSRTSDPRLAGRAGARAAARVAPLDLVARALVGEEPRRDRAGDLAVPEHAQLARVGHLADHGAVQLPAGADRARPRPAARPRRPRPSAPATRRS